MKVLLINPPWSRDGFYGVRAGSRWPHLENCETTGYMPFPFFMAYAAAVLEREGLPVLVVDACAEKLDDDECFKRMRAFEPDVAVIETSTPTIEIDLIFASRVKEVFPGTKTVFCGAHAPMLNTSFLDNERQIDFVMRGEYEMILLELVRALQGQGDFSTIKGIFYRDKNNEVIDTGIRPLLKDLDSLPWPARHLFPMDLYDDRPGEIPLPSLQMWASRGCPFQCIFCVWPQVMYGGNTYRTRDPKDVADEIDYCVKKWGFKSFYFDDDTFNIGKSRIIRLCEELLKRGIRLPWGVMARADLVDREILQAMKKAGLVSIKYGMESGVQQLIDASGKKLKVEQVEEAVRLSKELGIETHLTFTFGLPGETKETVRLTLKKVKEIDPFSVQFSIATPFPGTVHHKALEEKGYIQPVSWEDYSGSTGAVHRTEALSPEDLNQVLANAYSEWDLHRLGSMKHWPILIKNSLSHPRGSISRLFSLFRHKVSGDRESTC
jgi:radical SAM superfamily enzyme YgiQ (UPF0313 family)